MRTNNNLLDDGQGQQSSPTVGAITGGNKRINRCSIKFVMPKEKAVLLVREDG